MLGTAVLTCPDSQAKANCYFLAYAETGLKGIIWQQTLP